MISAIELSLAGLWPTLWHFGLGSSLVIGLMAAAYFSPVFKKDFFYAALIVGAFMVAEDIGIHDANKITTAKEKIVTTQVDKAVKKSETPKARHAKDPWDRKEY